MKVISLDHHNGGLVCDEHDSMPITDCNQAHGLIGTIYLTVIEVGRWNVEVVRQLTCNVETQI